MSHNTTAELRPNCGFRMLKKAVAFVAVDGRHGSAESEWSSKLVRASVVVALYNLALLVRRNRNVRRRKGVQISSTIGLSRMPTAERLRLSTTTATAARFGITFQFPRGTGRKGPQYYALMHIQFNDTFLESQFGNFTLTNVCKKKEFEPICCPRFISGVAFPFGRILANSRKKVGRNTRSESKS